MTAKKIPKPRNVVARAPQSGAGRHTDKRKKALEEPIVPVRHVELVAPNGDVYSAEREFAAAIWELTWPTGAARLAGGLKQATAFLKHRMQEDIAAAKRDAAEDA